MIAKFFLLEWKKKIPIIGLIISLLLMFIMRKTDSYLYFGLLASFFGIFI
jgi:hypothetical protein